MEYSKEYYKKNKDKFKQYRKKYVEDHKEEIKEKQKKYYENHKERIRQAQKEYLLRNKGRFNKNYAESRKRRIERLRNEGITNPWSVVMNKAEPKYQQPMKYRTCVRYNKNNEVIEIYDSVEEAANKMNVDINTIRKACQGKIKTSCGSKWKFIDDIDK